MSTLKEDYKLIIEWMENCHYSYEYQKLMSLRAWPTGFFLGSIGLEVMYESTQVNEHKWAYTYKLDSTSLYESFIA